MSVFSHPAYDGHEKVIYGHDAETGLEAIIAIHNTNLGPACGGCRMWAYGSEEEALTDVLRLARGMTYKSALANLKLGGGKSVIIGDPKRDKNAKLMRAMGRLVDSLGGSYIVAEDVGTTEEDMDAIALETRYVAGTSNGCGNPSPYTAYGVYLGIRAAVQHWLKRNAGDLEKIKVAIQGLGQVGYPLARYLREDGAELFVSDISDEAMQKAADEFGAKPVPAAEVYDAPVDVFAPCAMGAVINDLTVARLQACIVAGSANNQLAEDRHGLELARRGVLYAPDYVINAGGVIEVAFGAEGTKEEITRHVEGIGPTLLEIFARADADKKPTNEIADRLAEERFLAA